LIRFKRPVMAEQDPIAAIKARWSYIQPYLFPFLRQEIDPLPGRLGHARELSKVCNSRIEITRGRIAKQLFAEHIFDQSEAIVATRSAEYAPPP
jgi:hypothetical protein